MIVNRSLKITPPNQNSYLINERSQNFKFGLFNTGNEEFGPQPIIFSVNTFPKSIAGTNNDNYYFEFLDDMLSIFNVVNFIRKEEINNFDRVDKANGMFKHHDVSENLVLVKEKYVISNIFKKTYFVESELDQYVDIYLEKNNFNNIVNSKHFVNNLLLASLKHEVFMVGYLWSEMINNQMYSVMNAYKIHDIVSKLNLQLKRKKNHDKKVKELVTELDVLLGEIKDSSLGKFANNMMESGVQSRHGGSYPNMTTTEDKEIFSSTCFDKKINSMHKDITEIIKLYFIIITNYHYFDK